MSSLPDAVNAAVIEAFCKIPTWLERSEALIARACMAEDTQAHGGRGRWCPRHHHGRSRPFPMSENPKQFRRYIAPVLREIVKTSSLSSKQGAHV